MFLLIVLAHFPLKMFLPTCWWKEKMQQNQSRKQRPVHSLLQHWRHIQTSRNLIEFWKPLPVAICCHVFLPCTKNPGNSVSRTQDCENAGISKAKTCTKSGLCVSSRVSKQIFFQWRKRREGPSTKRTSEDGLPGNRKLFLVSLAWSCTVKAGTFWTSCADWWWCEIDPGI